MFEKLNSIIYNDAAGTVVKCVTSRSEAIAERATLSVLGRNNSGDIKQTILVPRLIPELTSDFAVGMDYVPGIRVYDLIALLNDIIRSDPDRGIVLKAYLLKNELISSALRCVRQFQDNGVQNEMKAAIGGAVAPYDFQEKLVEALDYLCARLRHAPTGKLYDEAAQISDFLSTRIEVTFRDSTLKNFIVKLHNAPGRTSDYSDFVKTSGNYLRPTNWQWTDQSVVPRLLEELNSPAALAESIYSVDFESTYALTTKQDDFLHIFTLEVAGISYEIARRFFEKDLAVDEEDLNIAIVFRCVRDGVRRLFYKCERPAIFATRYHHETVDHNLLVALDALERLRQNSDKSEFLGQLYSLLSICRKGCSPWPWNVSAHPFEFSD